MSNFVLLSIFIGGYLGVSAINWIVCYIFQILALFRICFVSSISCLFIVLSSFLLAVCVVFLPFDCVCCLPSSWLYALTFISNSPVRSICLITFTRIIKILFYFLQLLLMLYRGNICYLSLKDHR